MAQQKGTGVVWAIGSFTATGATIEATDNVIGDDFTREADKEELRNNSGDVDGCVYYNMRKSRTVTVVPSQDTIANAKTAANAMLPEPGTQVVLTDTDFGDHDGNFICESATMRRTNTSAAVIEMNLLAYATDISADIDA